jgi:hypothetical protein
MEEKFYLRNRGDGDYFLESRTNNSASVVGSLNPTHFAEHKLSLKNCQAIELGYDLDDSVDYFKKGKTYIQQDGVIILAGENATDGIVIKDPLKSRGVGHYSNEWNPKAFCEYSIELLEILGDKKFSEEQMLQAFLKGVSLQIDAPTFQQSLQQKEWEVEIEMETIWVGQCNCPCHSDGVMIMHFMACCHPKMVESPKLDADGCLILKRK